MKEFLLKKIWNNWRVDILFLTQKMMKWAVQWMTLSQLILSTKTGTWEVHQLLVWTKLQFTLQVLMDPQEPHNHKFGMMEQIWNNRLDTSNLMAPFWVNLVSKSKNSLKEFNTWKNKSSNWETKRFNLLKFSNLKDKILNSHLLSKKLKLVWSSRSLEILKKWWLINCLLSKRNWSYISKNWELINS